MNSGSSGSLQSSSGGEEEYDSRADSISAFLNQTGHVGPVSNPPSQPPLSALVPTPPRQHHAASSSMFFDPLPNYFDPISRPPQSLQNPSSLLNLDSVWSKTIRSDPNSIEINPMLPSSSSLQSLIGCSQGQPSASLITSQSPMVQLPPVTDNSTAPRASSSSSATSEQTHVVRNPRKRSRASRRAPTTVLTTDTTNFRAMVQEFTGIPAPPFTSLPFPRCRLDLFGTPSLRSSPLDISRPPYPLRPFAQKFQPPAFVSSSSPSSGSSLSSSFLSSSLVDTIASTSTNITSGSAIASLKSGSVNYQLPSESGPLKQTETSILNMQNPILTFQSFLQPPPKHPLTNSASLGSKPQGSLEIPSNESHIKIGALFEIGLGHGHGDTQVSELPNLVPSDRNRPSNDNGPLSWGDGVASNHGDQAPLRSVNGSYNYSQDVTNGKLSTYSASSSGFHGNKGSENVAIRGEGMMESWICSSD